MKRLLIILCVLGVAVLLAGCGNDRPPAVPHEETAGATTTAPQEDVVLTSSTAVSEQTEATATQATTAVTAVTAATSEAPKITTTTSAASTTSSATTSATVLNGTKPTLEPEINFSEFE